MKRHKQTGLGLSKETQRTQIKPECWKNKKKTLRKMEMTLKMRRNKCLNGGHMKPEINIFKKKQGTFWVRQCRVWPWPSAAAQSWGSSDTGRRCTGCKCTCSAAGRGWRDTRETHQHVFITPAGKAHRKTLKRSSKVTANVRRRRNEEDRVPQRVAALVQCFFIYQVVRLSCYI